MTLTFRGLYRDAPELPDDLDLLYRVAADEFDVAVDDETIYREVDFPVIELAQALDSWLTGGMPRLRDFDFEPTGGEPGVLRFERGERGWFVASSQPRDADRRPHVLRPRSWRHRSDAS